MPEMVDAICRESELQKAFVEGKTIETIYFGGGTPSMLQPDMLTKLMDSIQKHHVISADAEITLEANPDDIISESLRSWKTAGINRLSIGVQSFRDVDLNYLNRVHNAARAVQCLKLAQDAGFHNLTLDLIFGIPTLDDDAWLQNINTVVEMKIPHISAYALTVEPKTALDVMIRKGKAAPVDDEQSARHFEWMMTAMEVAGYLHYEISNYCLPGKFARHNTAYWQGETYLGLGPSAHSYNGLTRRWNVSGIADYLDAIKNGSIPAESETLSVDQKYDEYVMTGLRTIWGCDADVIRKRFGSLYADYFSKQAVPWISRECVVKDGEIYTLTRKGKLQADGIASDLFYPDREKR
jgi:oxygen-independent coproporphyrinogen-3 oxidase